MTLGIGGNDAFFYLSSVGQLDAVAGEGAGC